VSNLQGCPGEHARLKKIFSEEFSTEPLTSQHCEACGVLARQMDSVRRLVKVYGNVAAVAKQLGVAHTTVRSWKKKLEAGETLSFNVEARLKALNPSEEWSKELLFGFDGAMYSLPALLAIHRCRMLGHLNISVRRFPASGIMAQSLKKGSIHLAVMSKTMWNLVATDEQHATTVFALVDIGVAPIQGVAGSQIAHIEDFSGMTVYYPAGTAVGTRIRELFDTFDTRPRLIEPVVPAQAKTLLAKATLTVTALIGPPLWVKECIGADFVDRFQEIRSSFLPSTPATLAYNKDCPRAPLRLFLMSLDEVLTDIRQFLNSEDWDLGSKEVNEDLKQLVVYARHASNKDGLVKFRRDNNFFSLVSLWNAEVQTLGRALSGGR